MKIIEIDDRDYQDLATAYGADTYHAEILLALASQELHESPILSPEQIRNLAFYDQLTGLPNRRMFFDRLQQATATSALSPPDLALVQLFWSTPLQLPCFATTVGVIGALSGAVLFVCYKSWWRMPLRAAARIEDLQSLDKLLRGSEDDFGDIQVAEHATARPSEAIRSPLPKPQVY